MGLKVELNARDLDARTLSDGGWEICWSRRGRSQAVVAVITSVIVAVIMWWVAGRWFGSMIVAVLVAVSVVCGFGIALGVALWRERRDPTIVGVGPDGVIKRCVIKELEGKTVRRVRHETWRLRPHAKESGWPEPLVGVLIVTVQDGAGPAVDVQVLAHQGWQRGRLVERLRAACVAAGVGFEECDRRARPPIAREEFGGLIVQASMAGGVALAEGYEDDREKALSGDGQAEGKKL